MTTDKPCEVCHMTGPHKLSCPRRTQLSRWLDQIVALEAEAEQKMEPDQSYSQITSKDVAPAAEVARLRAENAALKENASATLYHETLRFKRAVVELLARVDVVTADKNLSVLRVAKLEEENADQKQRLLFLTTACQGYENVERDLKARLEWFEKWHELAEAAMARSYDTDGLDLVAWEREHPKPEGSA